MIRVPFGSGIAGRVAETGTSMNIPDAYACGLFNPAIDRKTGFRTRNILCCPISDMSGNHVAVIQVCTAAAFACAASKSLVCHGKHTHMHRHRYRAFSSSEWHSQAQCDVMSWHMQLGFSILCSVYADHACVQHHCCVPGRLLSCPSSQSQSGKGRWLQHTVVF